MMKSSHMILLIVLVVFAGLLVGASVYGRQWEYSRLHYGVYSKWNWMEPEVFVEGETIGELCRNLGVTAGSDVGTIYTIADWAGGNGWEMVMATKLPQEYIVIWFKRAK